MQRQARFGGQLERATVVVEAPSRWVVVAARVVVRKGVVKAAQSPLVGLQAQTSHPLSSVTRIEHAPGLQRQSRYEGQVARCVVDVTRSVGDWVGLSVGDSVISGLSSTARALAAKRTAKTVTAKARISAGW